MIDNNDIFFLIYNMHEYDFLAIKEKRDKKELIKE